MRMWSALLVVGIVATLCRSGDGTVTYGRPYSYNQYEERDRTLDRANAGAYQYQDRVDTQEPGGKTVIRDSSGNVAYADAISETEHERRSATGTQGPIRKRGYSGKKEGDSVQKEDNPVKNGGQSVKKGGQSVPKSKPSGQGQVSGRDKSIKQGPNNRYPQRYPDSYSQRDAWGHSTSRREDEDLNIGGYSSQYGNEGSYRQNDGYYSSQHRGSEEDVNDYRIREYSQGGYNQGGYNQGGYNQGGYNQGENNQGRYNQGRGQGYKKVEDRPKNRRPASYQEKYESQWIGNKASASADQDRYGYNTPYGSGYGEHNGARANAESNKYDQSWEKYY